MNFLATLLSCSALLFILPPLAPVEWQGEKTYDFGDIRQGEPVVYEFKYTNTGTAPLVIDNVRVACGCTTPDWEETPLPTDSTGIIRVEYDARDEGYFRKYIKVYFNGYRKAEKLYIEGYVEPN